MSPFLSKTLLLARHSVASLAKKTCGNVCSLRWFSIGSECKEQQSYTVSYLIKSLGFSEKAALSTSRFVKFDGPDKPDKAVEFLRNFGFTPNQISKLVRESPQLLVTDTEKTILPKLEFLVSKGISRPELVERLSIFPTVLRPSLSDKIIPSYECLKTLLRSDEKTIEAVKQSPDILTVDVEKCYVPNIATLREHGIPDSNIATLIHKWPIVFMKTSTRFREIMNNVARIGFDPSKLTFLLAMAAVSHKTNFDRKFNLYKKWGWTDTEISEAFLRCPRFMVASEDKIVTFMEFFTAKMGLQPADLVKFPIIFTYSLDKRLIPRDSFYKALLSKGLVKKQVPVSTLMGVSEKLFFKQFVMPYVKESPELLKLYNEIFGLSSIPESGKASQ